MRLNATQVSIVYKVLIWNNINRTNSIWVMLKERNQNEEKSTASRRSSQKFQGKQWYSLKISLFLRELYKMVKWSREFFNFLMVCPMRENLRIPFFMGKVLLSYQMVQSLRRYLNRAKCKIKDKLSIIMEITIRDRYHDVRRMVRVSLLLLVVINMLEILKMAKLREGEYITWINFQLQKGNGKMVNL